MAETITLRAYLNDIASLLESESVNEVISHCKHILQHQPHNVETYRLLGKALLQKGHFEGSIEQFNEAADVFRRVLSVDPTDFVSHLGMSEVYQETGRLDQAIWHMERAYEQQPGNMALQDALRQLYIARDGEARAPQKIQLTRAALARQYANGRLYDQALIELRTAIEKAPDRVDLELLLAEILWDSQHFVEAGEAAGRVLDKLPDCLPAQRILAQLWLHYQRPVEAQRFLQRVEALDPYLAARLLRPNESFPDPVRLERLDYGAQMASSFSGETPDWIQDLGVFDGGGLTMKAAVQPPVMASPPSWPRPEISGSAPPYDDQSVMVDWTSDQALSGPGPDMSEIFSDLTQQGTSSQSTPDRWAVPPDIPAQPFAEEDESVPDWFADLGVSQEAGVSPRAAHEDDALDFEALMADSSGGAGQMDDWLSQGESEDLFPNVDDLIGDTGHIPVPPPESHRPLFDETTWLPPLEEVGPPAQGSEVEDTGEPFDSLSVSDRMTGSADEEELGDVADWLFLEEQVSGDTQPAAELSDLGGLFDAQEAVAAEEPDFDALFGSMEQAVEDVGEQVEEAAAKMSDLGGLFDAQEAVVAQDADFDALFGSMEQAVEDVGEQVEEAAAEVSDLGGLFDAQETAAAEEVDFDTLFGSMEQAVGDVSGRAEEAAAEVSDLGGLFDAQETAAAEEVDFDTLFGSMEQAVEGGESVSFPQEEIDPETVRDWQDRQRSYAADIEEFDALFGGGPVGIEHSDVPSGFTELLQGVSQQTDVPLHDLPDVSQIEPPGWISAAYEDLSTEVDESQPASAGEMFESTDQVEPLTRDEAAATSGEWGEPQSEQVQEETQSADSGLVWDEAPALTESGALGERPAEPAADWLVSEQLDIFAGEAQAADTQPDEIVESAAGWLGQGDSLTFEELSAPGEDGDWLSSFAKPEAAEDVQVPGDVLDLAEDQEAPIFESELTDELSEWLTAEPEAAVEDLGETAGSVVEEVRDVISEAQEEIGEWFVDREETQADDLGLQLEEEIPAQSEPVAFEPAAEEMAVEGPLDALDTAYDLFAAGSPDQVPEYQSAKKTGVLQPNELPSWMAAFSGDQTLLTDEELEEPANISLRDLDLGLEDEQPEAVEVEDVTDQDQGQAEVEEAEPEEAPAWGEAEAAELIEGEGEMPSWLAAITSSASVDLDPEEFGIETLDVSAELTGTGSAEDAAGLFAEGEESAEAAIVPEGLAQARDAAAAAPINAPEDTGDLDALFDEYDAEKTAYSESAIRDEPIFAGDSGDLPWLAVEEVPNEAVLGESVSAESASVDELDALFSELDGQYTQESMAGQDQVAHADDLTDTRSVVSDRADWEFDEDLFADEEDEGDAEFTFDDVTPAWLRTPKDRTSPGQTRPSSRLPNDPPEWLRNALEDDEDAP